MAANHEKVYLEEDTVKVTSSRVILDDQHYVLRNISSVQAHTEYPHFATCFLLGMLGMTAFWFVDGALRILAGAFWIGGSYLCVNQKGEHHVRVSTGGTADRTVVTDSKEFQERIIKAINDALVDLDKKESIRRPTTPPQVMDSSSELKKFKQMLDDGLISQKDYDAKKKQILGL